MPKSTNPERPDGSSQKLLYICRITSMGWGGKTVLHTGLSPVYSGFLAKTTRKS